MMIGNLGARGLMVLTMLVAWPALFQSLPAVNAADNTVTPVDEAAQDPSLVDYRGKLLDAIARRDVDYVVSQAANDIKLSFGGSEGQREFRKLLTLSKDDLADEYKHQADERREGYWDALEEVFRMGGQFTGKDIFEAPYTWTAKLPDDSDPYSTYLIIKQDAPLRDRPSKYGAVISSVSYEIVTRIKGGEGTEFQNVKLASGVEGFVHEDDLRSTIDYRAILHKTGGKWKLSVFISGD